MDVHLVVGEHETDPLVLADRLAEGGAPPRVIRGDVVRATRGAEPTHAMRQTRRGEPHLRVAKTLADPTQDLAFVHPQSVEPDDCMTPGHVLVERVQHPFDMNPRRAHRREEHRRAGGPTHVALVARHDDAEIGADRSGDQPFAPVDDKLVTVAAGGRQQHRGVRSGTGSRFGHHETRADLPRRHWPQPLLLLALLGDFFDKVHVAFIGRKAVERHRPERGVAGGLEYDRLAAVIEPKPAPIAADMRAERPASRPSATSSRRKSSLGPCALCRGSPSNGKSYLAQTARYAPSARRDRQTAKSPSVSPGHEKRRQLRISSSFPP